MQLLTLPVTNVIDISKSLRDLADVIDSGDYEGARQLVWIIDCGESINYGLIGKSSSVNADFNLLLDIAKSSLMVNL